MKQFERRLVSGIMIAGMTVMMLPAAGVQAAQAGTEAAAYRSAAAAARVTDFFGEREHTELTYEEMEAAYYHYDPTEFMEGLDELLLLAGEEENGQAVIDQYEALKDEYTEAITLVYIASNASQRDVTDSQWAAEYMYVNGTVTQMSDEFCITVRDALQQPGGEALADYMGEDLAAEFAEYEEMTQEQFAYSEEQSALVLEYHTRQSQAAYLTVLVNGEEMNQTELTDAYLAGDLDDIAFLAAASELEKAQNEYLGEIYLELVELRKDLAELMGYDNYGDLMYESYGRDYTQESIQEFADAVKESLVEPYIGLQRLIDPMAACLNQAYPYQEVFDIMVEYLPEISTELEESFQYLLRNELYDLEYSETKTTGAYTAPLMEYGAAYIYMQPIGNAYDFSGSLIHEFGHFNAFYHNEIEWYESMNLDIAEVHSQGLEALFLNYYDSIFGDEAQTMREFVLMNLLAACIQGCLVNELETYVYATEDVTLEQINTKFMELAKDYGLVDETNPNTELYTWCSIPHLFQSPCYYISYATSVAAAFEIWELSLQDYEEAADAYLLFTSYGFESGYLDTLEQAGLGNPLDAESVAGIGNAMMEYFDIENRLEALYGGGTGAGEEEENGETGSGTEEEPDDPAEEEPAYKQCYIRSGDSLSKIGQRYQTDWREIASLNGLEAPYRIYAGDTLLLPEDAVIQPETYTVQTGDTLGKIAAKLGMDWRIMAGQLGIEAPYTIYVGEVLTFTY